MRSPREIFSRIPPYYIGMAMLVSLVAVAYALWWGGRNQSDVLPAPDAEQARTVAWSRVGTRSSEPLCRFALSTGMGTLPEQQGYIWREIDRMQVRWTAMHGPLMIATGPVFDKQRSDTLQFRVMLTLHPDPLAVAFVVNRRDSLVTVQDCVRSVQQVERLTGLDFFSTMPKQWQKQVERQSNLSLWNM